MHNAKRMGAKSYCSSSRLALVTVRLILYLWYAGIFVARRTYRYSSLLNKHGRNLWPRRAVGMLAGRHGFYRLGSVIPPLKTSWQLLKSIERHLRHQFKAARSGGSTMPLKLASQQLLTVAKAAAQLEGVCNFGAWKHKIKRVTGVSLAEKALSVLSKISRRNGLERRRSDRRRFLRSALRASKWKHFASQHIIKDRSFTPKEVDSRIAQTNSSTSWGEIVQRNDDLNNGLLKQYNNRFSLYKKVPLKTMSRMWGQFNQMELPHWMRKPAFSLYIWMFKCSLEEAAIQDLKHYRNLSEFFRRDLRAGIRPVDGAHVLTSPADGRVLNCGVVKNGALEQVKGVTYSMVGFLGPLENLNNAQSSQSLTCGEEGMYDWQQLLINPANKLYHCIIYLAPGDYHRFHSPTDWNVYARRHFPGELFSVSPGVARWLQGLFNFNERAVYSGKWTHGFFSMTAVGATNVGSINVCFDKGLTTNTSSIYPAGSYYDHQFSSDKKRSIQMKKGQLMGDFNLGSTIVLLFEAPENFRFSVKPGQRLRYGQGVGGFFRQQGIRSSGKK